MEDGTREWMDAGAGALCLGLDYQPSANASFEELVRLCRVTAEHGGIYAAHQRYAHLGRPVAWRETIELAKASGCPVHVSHERVDPESGAALEQVDREGVDLSFESYLYPAGMTHLEMALPIHLHPGGWPAMVERLRQPAIRSLAVAWLAKYLGRADQFVGYTRSGRHVGQRMARPRRGGRQAGRRVRLRPRHGGGGRGHAGVPLADAGGGARTGDRGDRRAPAHDGRQRRRLRRPGTRTRAASAASPACWASSSATAGY